MEENMNKSNSSNVDIKEKRVILIVLITCATIIASCLMIMYFLNKCQYDNEFCFNLVGIDGKYCKLHLCKNDKCANQIVNENTLFCINHKCKDEICNNSISDNVFCEEHNCKYNGCINKKGNFSDYCTEHTCIINDCIFVKEEDAVYCQKHMWNVPKLKSGLIPVNWVNNEWTETTIENWEYNYNSVAQEKQTTVEGNGNGKWANAITSDGSIYVWIPRYTYKIISGEDDDVSSWNSVILENSDEEKGKIEIMFSHGIIDYTSYGYKKHPAFTFGEKEIEGFWIAKYEASRNDATSDSEGKGTKPMSKPNVKSWLNMNVSNMFSYSYNLNRNLESHMLKNMEWGAVAYLTNAIGKIPYNNNSNYITGASGKNQNDQKAGEGEYIQDGSTIKKKINPTYMWNTPNGVKASTTHNVYGVYDMAGGASEYVAAYVQETLKYSNNKENAVLKKYASKLFSANSKYKDVYISGGWYDTNGDAINETSAYVANNSKSTETQSWDGDRSYLPLTQHTGIFSSFEPHQVFCRGGDCQDGYGAGIFAYTAWHGDAEETTGFRVALIVE